MDRSVSRGAANHGHCESTSIAGETWLQQKRPKSLLLGRDIERSGLLHLASSDRGYIIGHAIN